MLGQPSRRPVLIAVSGLPATGKTAVARALAADLRAAYVRIDSIENAIDHAQGRFRESNDWELPPGYSVGYAVAGDLLCNRLDVVADAVNPVRSSRDAWRQVAAHAEASIVEVELICSDTDEHRRRAEGRVVDIPGLVKPTWEQITGRECDSWDRDRLVIDTAALDVEARQPRSQTTADQHPETPPARSRCRTPLTSLDPTYGQLDGMSVHPACARGPGITPVGDRSRAGRGVKAGMRALTS